MAREFFFFGGGGGNFGLGIFWGFDFGPDSIIPFA